MNSKHTPGPWKVGTTLMGNPGIYSTANDRITHIVTLPVLESKAVDNDEERKGNIALIAAAPELLEALQDAQATIRYLQEKFITIAKEHDHAATRVANTLDLIENVVSKAA